MAMIDIEINNWDKYQYRPDVKNPSWFRFENNFFEDECIFELNAEQKMLFIYCLTIASRKQKPRIRINTKQCAQKIPIKQGSIEAALRNIQEFQLVTVHVTSTLRTRTADDTPACSTYIHTDIHTDSGKPDNAPLRNSIIDYLNNKTNRNFKSNSDNSVKHINARLNEGYKYEDFTRVIDTKTDQWLNDAENNMYLRPETLFGKKFDGYLNQKTGIEIKKAADTSLLDSLKEECGEDIF